MTKLEEVLKDFAVKVETAVLQDAAGRVSEALGPIIGEAVLTAMLGPIRPAPARRPAKHKAHANGVNPTKKPTKKPKLKPAGTMSKDAQKDAILERAAKLFAHINENPGQNAEAIAKATSLTTADLKAPIRVLLAEKKIKAAGKARGTKYTARADS